VTQTRSITCIVCPLGCKISVKMLENGGCLAAGNGCKNGGLYAETEMTNPVRMLTTTISVRNGAIERLPVRTDKAVSKSKIPEYLQTIKRIKVEAPIKMGEVIGWKLLDTDVCVIAAKNIDRFS